jgi:hypothetical protein
LTLHRSNSTAPEENSGKNIFSICDKGVGPDLARETT